MSPRGSPAQTDPDLVAGGGLPRSCTVGAVNARAVIVGTDVGGTADNVAVLTDNGTFLIDQLLEVPSQDARRTAGGAPAGLRARFGDGGLRSVIRKQAERVTVGVDHHADVVLRFMVGESGALFDCPEHAGVEVRAPMSNCIIIVDTAPAGPGRSMVLRRPLDLDLHAAVP